MRVDVERHRRGRRHGRAIGLHGALHHGAQARQIGRFFGDEAALLGAPRQARLVMEAREPLPRGGGRGQVIADQRGQAAVPPQRLEIVETLAAQRTQQHERFDELAMAQALRRLLRRQVPVRGRDDAATPPQVDQQRHPRMGRDGIRQPSPQIEIQRVWHRSAAHRLHLRGEAYTIKPTDWGTLRYPTLS